MSNQDMGVNRGCSDSGGNGSVREHSVSGLGMQAPCGFLLFRPLLVLLKRTYQGHVMERELPVAASSHVPANTQREL